MSPLFSDLKLTASNQTVGGIKTTIWRHAGSDKSRRLLLLHGVGGSHVGLMPLASSMTDYDIVIPDLPGHGNSQMPNDPSVELLRFWLDDLVSQLNPQNATPMTIIAHSMSVRIALEAAVNGGESWPINNLVLLNPVPGILPWVHYTSRALDILPLKLQHLLEESDLMEQARVNYLLIRKTESNRDFMRHSWQESTRKELANFGLYQALRRELADDKFFLELNSAPDSTFCIVGDKDNLVAADSTSKLQRLFGNEKVLVCPGTGHLMPIEAPEDTAEIIRKLLG